MVEQDPAVAGATRDREAVALARRQRRRHIGRLTVFQPARAASAGPRADTTPSTRSGGGPAATTAPPAFRKPSSRATVGALRFSVNGGTTTVRYARRPTRRRLPSTVPCRAMTSSQPRSYSTCARSSAFSRSWKLFPRRSSSAGAFPAPLYIHAVVVGSITRMSFTCCPADIATESRAK